jgi:hypothetical protein
MSTKHGSTNSRTTELLAKQKRRRRKDSSGASGAGSSSSSSGSLPGLDLNDDGSLPDFDLGDDESVPDLKSSKKPAKADIDFNEISDAMMGDTSKATVSIEALIGDRSLESKFEFEGEEEDISIPDFTTFAKASGATQELEVGKKKARQTDRRAAAIQAKEAAEEDIPLFQFLRDEKGKISPIKILETGAWAGIYSLIGWELFLNSPLFERLAPVIPVIFE